VESIASEGGIASDGGAGDLLFLDPARDRGADEDGERERDEARCLRPEVRSFGAIRLAVWREEQRVCGETARRRDRFRRANRPTAAAGRMGRARRVDESGQGHILHFHITLPLVWKTHKITGVDAMATLG
jgi:hypothetical protein